MVSKKTWCDKCNEADLGLKEPSMFKENGKTFIEGKCIICGEPQTSTVTTKEVKE